MSEEIEHRTLAKGLGYSTTIDTVCTEAERAARTIDWSDDSESWIPGLASLGSSHCTFTGVLLVPFTVTVRLTADDSQELQLYLSQDGTIYEGNPLDRCRPISFTGYQEPWLGAITSSLGKFQ